MAKINFDFVANADGLLGEVDKVSRELSDGVDEVKKFGKAHKVALGVVAAAAAAAAASVVLLSKETLKLAAAGNTYAKSAKKVGSTAEDIQRLEGAFDLLTDANISASRVIQDFGRNLADARDGTGEAKDELAKLGLAAEDFAGLRVDEQIALVADRFGRLQDASEKSQVAMAVFGRAGRELVPALTQGGDAVRDAAGAIDDAGIISNEAAASSEALTDAIELMSRKFGTLLRDVVVPFVPVMGAAAEKMGDFVKSLSDGGIVAGFGSGIANVAIAMLGLTDEVKAFKEAVADAEAAGKTQKDLYDEASDAATAQAEKVDALRGQVERLNKVNHDSTIATKELAAAEKELITLNALAASSMDLLALSMEAEAADSLSAARALELKAMADEFAAKNAARHAKEEEKLAGAIKATAETEAGALSDLMDAARRMTESRLEGAAALEAAAQREIEDIQEMATAIIDSETATAAERVEARETAADAVLGIEEQLAADLAELRAEARQERADDLAAEVAANQAAADEMRRAREEAQAAQLQSAVDFVHGVSDLLNAAAEAEVNQTEAGTAARKEALKKQFEINKATAIANAAVNTVLAASNAFGNAPNPIVGAVLAALATAVGIGQVAAIASKPPPTFHSGTSAIRAADLAPDEGMARVRAGEAVASPQGVANLGGREAIDRANRGGGGGAAPIVVISKVNNRTTDVSTHEQIRRPDSPFSEALRSVQPRPVGSHRVWG